LLPIVDVQFFITNMMLAASDEVYLIDAATMQLVYVSENALLNSGFDLEGAKQQKLDGLLGMSQQALQRHVENNLKPGQVVEVSQNQEPISTKAGDFQLRVMLMQADGKEYILVIKNEITSNERIAHELSESETRFRAIVSNTPGTVVQFMSNSEDEIVFIYLSDGSKAVLGLSPEELCQNPKQFYSIMNARDHSTLNARLKVSAKDLCVLDWEGRVWIDGWQDNKWINLRATPRKLGNGVIIWDGIMLNITQSKKEKFYIEQSRRDLAELTAHINTIREDERKKIAREIHDDLGGNLTAIKIGLSSMINRLNTGKDIPLEHAESLVSIVDSTFEAVHRISSDLRPNVLDLGIVAALDWQSKEFEKQLAIICKFTSNKSEVLVMPEQAITLFRIFQESMSNIVKHAHATHVDVDLNAGNHEIVMTISDNGVGIKSSDVLKENSFGLRGMRERAAALSGSFNIAQSTKQGTVITLILPID